MSNLPEYEANIFTRRLPPLMGVHEIVQALDKVKFFNVEERKWSPVARRHCVHRLRTFFFANVRHVEFADGFGLLLRQGYLGRGIDAAEYTRRVVELAEQAETKTLLDQKAPLGSDRGAGSSFLIGLPGMGKTLTVEEVLKGYPQIIRHDDAGLPAQIVWIKLECPPRGSIRALCVDFFQSVDELVGEGYTKLFATPNATDESMMTHMAIVANRHAIGVLVIDEIQHLVTQSTEQPVVMTFLTTLINKIGVPVQFIGTPSAMPLVTSTVRVARRSVGSLSPTWDRLMNDAEWDRLIQRLWQYQWTAEETPLTPELKAVFYDESQGVVDLAFKLFILVQMRLILRAERHSGGEYPEIITPDFVRQVAQQDFKLVEPFLNALRSGEPREIAKFDDLTVFNKAFDHTMARVEPDLDKVLATAASGSSQAALEVLPDDPEMHMIGMLRRNGLADDLISLALLQAREKVPNINDEMVFTEAVMTAVKSLTAAPKRKQARARSGVDYDALPADDLRRIVHAGSVQGFVGYEALLTAGMTGPGAVLRAA